MDERMRFVIRLKDGESMASLCREFGISRKTGYKIFERYEQCGLEGLSDRARGPFRYANQLPEQVEAAIVAAKREKPQWGGPQDPRALVAAVAARGQKCLRPAQCMRCSTGMAWCSAWRGHGRGPKALLSRTACGRMTCGALTTRASFSSATSATAIRSPSPITLRAICSCVKQWNQIAKNWHCGPLIGCFASAAYRRPFGQIMAFRSLARMLYFSFRSSRCGGCV